MRFTARQNGDGTKARGVARAALARIARRDLMQEAVRFLLATTNADRVGVWMESAETERVLGRRFVGFCGVVADRDGEATPSEW
jgi:ribosomal protein L21E